MEAFNGKIRRLLKKTCGLRGMKKTHDIVLRRKLDGTTTQTALFRDEVKRAAAVLVKMDHGPYVDVTKTEVRNMEDTFIAQEMEWYVIAFTHGGKRYMYLRKGNE